jgi:microcystin-dependent protein/type II secretory pathway pseudopilin PulG
MARKRGFSLIEISLVLLSGAILCGALVPGYVRSLYIEVARRTALEMSQVAEAARGYYIEHNAWPVDMPGLATAGFLDLAWVAKNPFGHDYVLVPAGADLVVETLVAEAMAPVVAGNLPMTVTAGPQVRMTVTPPGAAMQGLPPGTIFPWPAAQVPAGWLLCAGQVVARADYPGLFAVIGTTYGAGNGSTTFQLPDLRGRTVVGLDNMGTGAAGVIDDPLADIPGGRFGTSAHTLSVAEMPAHTHGYKETPWTGKHYYGGTGKVMTVQVNSQTLPAGGGQAHNNIQPSMALYWIIRT